MDSKINLQKRLNGDIDSPSKLPRLEASSYEENLEAIMNIQFDILDPVDNPTFLDTSNDLLATIQPKLEKEPSSSSIISAKDYLDDFCKSLNSQNVELSSTIPDVQFQDLARIDFQNVELPTVSVENSTPFFEQLQDQPENNTFSSNEVSSRTSPITELIHETSSKKTFVCDKSLTQPNSSISNVSECIPTSAKNKPSSYLFEEELGDFVLLTLKIHQNKYYISIKYADDAQKRDGVSPKNGLSMGIKCWYEFQYKIFAFNLKYESSSFVANNTILVLNKNNLFMSIKNLTNYSHIELNASQLEKLKGMTFDLNNSLIHHMYSKQLPNLIQQKCILKQLSNDESSSTFNILNECLEENLNAILNRIYECFGCTQDLYSECLHSCFSFNNREKYQQIGEALLLLVDINFIACTFSNRVDFISESFLCNINENTFHNSLFKSIK